MEQRYRILTAVLCILWVIFGLALLALTAILGWNLFLVTVAYNGVILVIYVASEAIRQHRKKRHAR